MSIRALTVLICAAGVFVGARDAAALNYKLIPDDGTGKRVLLVYDCDFIDADPDCPAGREPFRDGFDVGERERLQREWRRGPFAEVWLLSGGGLLRAGIDLANELRDQAQTVRVPNAARLRAAGLRPTLINGRPATMCVSSCTVAFMGGQFRFIDLEPGDEATYAVHASSAFGWSNLDQPQTVEAIKRNLQDANDLDQLAQRIAANGRNNARLLFAVFQDTLWLVVKSRAQEGAEKWSRDKRLGELLSGGYVYARDQHIRDRALLDLEGLAALQDILMRIERDSLRQAIEMLRGRLQELGQRADAALAMLEAMYATSSILETNQMPKETLLRMGYITEFIKT